MLLRDREDDWLHPTTPVMTAAVEDVNKYWLACRHPERPIDDDTCFCSDPCRSCAIALEAALNQLNPLTQPRLCAAVGELLSVALGEAER